MAQTKTWFNHYIKTHRMAQSKSNKIDKSNHKININNHKMAKFKICYNK